MSKSQVAWATDLGKPLLKTGGGQTKEHFYCLT